MTATGNKEAQDLEDFLMNTLQILWPTLWNFLPLFEPPESEPPARPIYHSIYVELHCIPASRPAYLLGDLKREAMVHQIIKLVN